MLNLSIKKAQEILIEQNYPVILTNGVLREDTHPFDNYHQLIKVSDKWEYSLVINEKTNQPKKKEIKEFYSEAEGAMYFLLIRLSNYYSREFVNSPAGELPDNLSINELIEALQKEGISKDKLRHNSKNLTGTFIYLKKVDEEHSAFSLYVNGKEQKTSIPIKNEWALNVVFDVTFLLDLFEKRLEPTLKRDNIFYEEKDIVTFVFS
ncbi:hypothetical protein [Shouchella miscanthi]|uniref:Uncharacterized protein n=1 Tax=Shouchella miscanthi TaxID=2598861 RepID=A0ABU6NPN6_9BACI|nr:hypothetical protein [Shouchella miscanthi]